MSRIDMYLDGNGTIKDKLRIIAIDDYVQIGKLPWMKDPDSSLSIKNKNGFIDFKVLCLDSGDLTFRLRSILFKVNNQKVPIFINYTSFIVNGREFLSENKFVDHDHPIIYDKKVEFGEVVDVHIEWEPC